jgi:hypothetical protein
MIIGSCIVELDLPGNGSLKGKRRILKPLPWPACAVNSTWPPLKWVATTPGSRPR